MTESDHDSWPDELFGWASERGSGDLTSFGKTFEWARRRAEPGWQPRDRVAARNRYLRDLSVLGFLEVDRPAGRWAVAPTTVTSLPSSDIGIIIGSRTPALLQALDGDDVSSLVDIREVRQHQVPRAILVRPRHRGALSALADAIGAVQVSCSARLIAARLPRLDEGEWSEAWAPEVPTDEIERFDTSLLQFVPAGSRPDDGLIRYTEFGQTKFLIGDRGAWRAVRRDVGIFLALARDNRTVLEWRRRNGGELRVPRAVRLPALHERVAVLCLGTLPAEDGPSLVYGNVPDDIASAVSSTLEQSVSQPTTEGATRAR